MGAVSDEVRRLDLLRLRCLHEDAAMQAAARERFHRREIARLDVAMNALGARP